MADLGSRLREQGFAGTVRRALSRRPAWLAQEGWTLLTRAWDLAYQGWTLLYWQWRRSLQFRIVSVTLLLSIALVGAFGWTVASVITNGLLSTKMQTAERLFTDRRIHEITLDEVAKKAQVGKGTIYRNFEDKDDLFFQVATSGFDDLCDLLQTDVEHDAPFSERLLQMALSISAFFEKRQPKLLSNSWASRP